MSCCVECQDAETYRVTGIDIQAVELTNEIEAGSKNFYIGVHKMGDRWL